MSDMESPAVASAPAGGGEHGAAAPVTAPAEPDHPHARSSLDSVDDVPLGAETAAPPASGAPLGGHPARIWDDEVFVRARRCGRCR